MYAFIDWLLDNKIKTLFFISILIGGLHAFSNREITQPAGIGSIDVPVQINKVEKGFPFWKNNNYIITPLATFDLHARTLSKEHYRLDPEAVLAEYDFIFSWGRMSDTDNIKDISFTQGGRFGYWSWSKPPNIPLHELSSSLSNMHLIPASDKVATAISNIQKGQFVHLRGKLVSVKGPNGYTWTSSLSRTDTGRGACEVFYVEEVDLER